MDDKEGMTLKPGLCRTFLRRHPFRPGERSSKAQPGRDLSFFPVNPKYRLEEIYRRNLEGESSQTGRQARAGTDPGLPGQENLLL